MNKLEEFIAVIAETRKVWLLQAMEGMFAMLEDYNGNSYIPVWESEALAQKSAVEDWEGYNVTEMGFSEMVVWLKELSRDEIDIAVSPEKDGEITAIASANFGKWAKQYDDHSYVEEEDDDDDDDDERETKPQGKSKGKSKGGVVDGFDYGEGWEHEF